jgi:aspartyl-tRNA(Asn)/glutamyl-tRNA(Gln) amidotransferase subunit A
MAPDVGSRPMSGDLHWLTAGEASVRIAAGKLSPADYVEALLTRIGAVDPKINAFIRLDAEGARTAARAAEAEIKAGKLRGPLHGMPVGIKDIVDVAGLPTTCHSAVLRDNVAKADAEVVVRLRAAGAIIMGKLSTHEFAIGGPSFDLPFPPARNPWNPNHHPGGSSSGSGAGLGAGLFPLAIGTDTGGSIRNPAGACGVFGLKPTYGRVSRKGVFPLAWSLDHVGPMARTAADAALMLDVMADQKPDAAGVTGRRLNIGFVRHFHEKDMPAADGVGAAVEDVAAALARIGHRIVDVSLPTLSEFSAVNRFILQAEAWAIHARWLRERPKDYGLLARRRLVTGAFLSAGDYIDAQRRRGRMIETVERVFEDVDVLLTANSMDPSCRIDDEVEINRTYPRQARTPFNLTGHPAAAFMCGLSQDGLPISAQLAGRFGDEALLLGLVGDYEREAGWPERHPAL